MRGATEVEPDTVKSEAKLSEGMPLHALKSNMELKVTIVNLNNLPQHNNT
jgi:hypothetical protein